MNDPTPKLATALRNERRRQNLSQAALADQLGVAQSLVSSWESARRTPRLHQLMALARALDVPLSTLLGADDQRRPEGLIAELRHWGLDLHAASEPVLLWVRPPEVVLTDALEEAAPRVVDRLPAMFLLNPGMHAPILEAEAEVRGVSQRLGWIAAIARALVRTGVGRPTKALQQLRLEPSTDAEWDGLGYPTVDRGELPPASRRWKVDYDQGLSGFANIVRTTLEGSTRA